LASAAPKITQWLFIALVLVLAACASDSPEAAVEGYFEALVAGDETAARSLSCAAWESVAATRINTFASLDAKLMGMNCQPDGEAAEGGTRVVCAGHIAVVYGTEEQELPLGNYRVVRENDAWRVCGETE